MKLCRIIPISMRPVYHILPNNRLISVPTEMPLSFSQIVRATAQANVFEVINGGEVLLTPENRFSDNTNAPVSTTVHEIKEYYNAKGERINPPMKNQQAADKTAVPEAQIPSQQVAQPVKEQVIEATKTIQETVKPVDESPVQQVADEAVTEVQIPSQQVAQPVKEQVTNMTNHMQNNNPGNNKKKNGKR